MVKDYGAIAYDKNGYYLFSFGAWSKAELKKKGEGYVRSRKCHRWKYTGSQTR